MSNTTTVSQALSTCPGCRQPIMARVTLELDLEPVVPESATVNATGKVVSMVVNHDCTRPSVRNSRSVSHTGSVTGL